MIPQIRIEFYIPTLYNPNKEGERKPIELHKKKKVKDTIVKKYGAISMHPLTIEGIWTNRKTKERHYDNCKKLEVCIDPKEGLDEELSNWKGELEELFEQFEVHIVYYYVNKI